VKGWIGESEYFSVTQCSSSYNSNYSSFPSELSVRASRGLLILTEYLYLTHTGVGITWAAMVGFDSLVFGMTLYKSIIPPRPNRGNILDILLRDGEFYLSGYIL